jgi:hypothetical protein
MAKQFWGAGTVLLRASVLDEDSKNVIDGH